MGCWGKGRNAMKIQHSMLLKLAIAGAATIAFASVASAKPDKPLNAATTDSGTGCFVLDGAGNYHVDTECEWHTVQKTDKDGNLVSFKYQDKGTVPEGAPLPGKAQKVDTDFAGCSEKLKEVTTPSGQYSSDCHWKAE